MTLVKLRRVVPLALLCAALVALAVAGLAVAIHPRPKSATPLRVSLVPAYEECTAPNVTHGPPLSFPSCSPPVQTSRYLTVGTPDANGAPAKSVGWFRFAVRTNPEELLVVASITDVRCKPGTQAAFCGTANSSDGPDYSGELEVDARIRITDHYNGPNHNEAATVVDLPNPVGLVCAATANTSIGGTCSFQGSPVQPAFPNQDWFVGSRVVIQIDQVRVSDGGQDGRTATADNTLFMTQGVFLP